MGLKGLPVRWLVISLLLGLTICPAQETPVPGNMLERDVPQVFWEQRLLLQVGEDSSWVVIRGDSVLDQQEVFQLMGAQRAYEELTERRASIERLHLNVWQHKLLSVGGIVGGGFYLLLTAQEAPVYQLPAALILGFSFWKWWEGQRLLVKLQREEYLADRILSPARIEKWVAEQNLELYQRLSRETIIFHPVP